MKSALVKVLASILATAVARLGPKLIGMAISRLPALNLPSVKGLMSAPEFEAAILKATGYPTLPALAIGVLTFASAHEGEYIKNGVLAYAIGFALTLVIQAIKSVYGGPEPTPTDPPTPAEAKALAEVANVPTAALAVEACPPGTCKFTGKICETETASAA